MKLKLRQQKNICRFKLLECIFIEVVRFFDVGGQMIEQLLKKRF